MYRKTFLKAKTNRPYQEQLTHGYRPSAAVLRIMVLVERAMARWMYQRDYWYECDTNVYPWEHIPKTVAQMLSVAVKLLPARIAA